MSKACILLLVAAVACGGAEAPEGTGPAVAPTVTATARASTSASAASSSAAAPQVAGTAPFALAADHPLPSNAPKPDSPAVLAKKYGGATVPLASRLRALGDFAAKWKTLASMPRAAKERAAVAWLSARPEIEAAGVGHSSVWARFKDGKMIIVPTYEWSAPAPAHAAAWREPSSRNAKTEIPESKARVTPAAFAYATNGIIRGWLGAHGYEDTNATPSIPSLRTKVKNAGLFYINTHGGDGLERDVKVVREFSDDHLYALWTSTPVLDADGKPFTGKGVVAHDLTNLRAKAGHNSQIDDELAHGELVYMYAKIATGWVWHYAFTHRFVKKFFTFSSHSLVYLNACESQGESSWAMTVAFLNAGADLVVGWTKEVKDESAMRAAEFVFDRMLGANQMNEYKLHPDKPFQRPWNFANTYGDLVHNHYDWGTNRKGEPTELVYTGNTEVALIPIIDKMESDDVQHVLTLHGTFGDDPGAANRKVTIAGAVCPVKNWSPTQITCALGNDFKHGDVIVEKLGRTSNPSPLTGWVVPESFEISAIGAGHFGWGLGFEAHVRGDVHAVRATPESTPTPRDPVSFYAAPDSKCGASGDKGLYVGPHGGKGWMTAAYGSLHLLEGPPMGTDWCVLYGKINPQNHKLKLVIFGVTAKNAGSFHAQGGGRTYTTGFGAGVIPVPGLFDGSVAAPPGMRGPAMPTAMFLPMDDEGQITANHKGPVSFPGTNRANVTVRWGEAKPDDYPTDQTPQ